MFRLSVGVGVTLGVSEAGAVAVGGSKVGGGLSVREGVNEASGVLGGTVFVAASAIARLVLVGGAPTFVVFCGGVLARLVPSAKAATIKTSVRMSPADICFNG